MMRSQQQQQQPRPKGEGSQKPKAKGHKKQRVPVGRETWVGECLVGPITRLLNRENSNGSNKALQRKTRRCHGDLLARATPSWRPGCPSCLGRRRQRPLSRDWIPALFIWLCFWLVCLEQLFFFFFKKKGGLRRKRIKILNGGGGFLGFVG